jgi:hypothetical protein
MAGTGAVRASREATLETGTVSGTGEGDEAGEDAVVAGAAEDGTEPATGPLGAGGQLAELADPASVAEGGRRWQRALMAASFVIAGLAIVGGAVVIVGSVTHGFKKPVQVTYKKSAVFGLRTGDCLDPRGTQSYTLVACDQPHDAEVFATFVLPAGQWPGTAAARTAASSGCATRLTGYLNPQLAVSLATTYVFPDSVAWQAGTRMVICEVQATSGQLSQSVRGASSSG